MLTLAQTLIRPAASVTTAVPQGCLGQLHPLLTTWASACEEGMSHDQADLLGMRKTGEQMRQQLGLLIRVFAQH
jgi:hypothetical protein